MASLDLRLASTKRYERAVWSYRVRWVLVAVGCAFVILGSISALQPFGPPISNPDVIPKADPAAGLGILQSIPLAMPHRMAVGLALVGAFMLLSSMFFGSGKPRTDGDNRE